MMAKVSLRPLRRPKHWRFRSLLVSLLAAALTASAVFWGSEAIIEKWRFIQSWSFLEKLDRSIPNVAPGACKPLPRTDTRESWAGFDAPGGSLKVRELSNYLSMAVNAARLAAEAHPASLEQAEAHAREALRELEFADDGYFYAYRLADQVLVAHPLLTPWEGERPGIPIVEHLIACAQKYPNGGLLEYEWPRPASDDPEPKVGLVRVIPGWGWMVGTGSYGSPVHRGMERLMRLRGGALWLSAVVFCLVWLSMTVTDLRRWAAFERAHAVASAALQEDERQRLSRELHDGLLQVLFSAKARLLQLSGSVSAARASGLPLGSEAIEELDQITEAVDTAAKEARSIAAAHAPVPLQRHGLVGALSQLAADSHHAHGVEVVFSTNTARVDPSREVCEALYRVAQEALRNVVKHARASRVLLRLERTPAQLTMSIEDDGVGYSTLATTEAGLGLGNMTARVGQAGGTLALQSEPGCTRVVVCFPQSRRRRRLFARPFL